MTAASIRAAVCALARADAGLAAAIASIGEPVIRTREPGFPGLFRIICAQQLSVASATAIRLRCEQGLGGLTAAAVTSADDAALRAFGLSAAKVRTLRAIADAIADGTLDLDAVHRARNTEAAAALTAIKGIGPWTAAIYLLFCDGRLDIWPPADVALRNAWVMAAQPATPPDQKAFDAMARERFAPHGGLAAHILWTYFGQQQGRVPV